MNKNDQPLPELADRVASDENVRDIIMLIVDLLRDSQTSEQWFKLVKTRLSAFVTRAEKQQREDVVEIRTKSMSKFKFSESDAPPPDPKSKKIKAKPVEPNAPGGFGVIADFLEKPSRKKIKRERF